MSDAVAAMRDAGVTAAVIVTSAVYGYDNSYSFDAVTAFPDKFAVIARIDPDPTGLDERLEALRHQPGFRGVRISLTNDLLRQRWRAGEYLPLLQAVEAADVPLCIFPAGLLAELPKVVARHSGLRFVIDHLGLGAPPEIPATEPPFAELPLLLALSKFRNVAVKLTAVPALSKEAYPFRDVWPHVRGVIDAFGPDRIMWGSDFTRTRSLHSYRDAVRYLDQIGLSPSEKELVFGATLRAYLRWPRTMTRSEGRAQH